MATDLRTGIGLVSRGIWRFLDDMRLAWLPTVVCFLFVWCLMHPSIITDQLDQYLVDYGDRFSQGRLSLENCLPIMADFLFVLCLSLIMAWSASTMLIVRRRGAAGSLLPFIVGLGPIVACSTSLARSSSVAEVSGPGAPQVLRASSAIACIALVLAFVCVRRLRSASTPESSVALIARASVALLLFLAMVVITGSPGRQETWFGVGFDHVRTIQDLGPLALICIAASIWLTIATVLVVLGRRWHFPLFVPIVVFFYILTTYSQDDHPVRRPFPQANSTDSRMRESFVRDYETLDRLNDWQSLRASDRAGTPIILVSAEGGGIRAAYFTAMALARIADDCPLAASHFFAISAVSGGAIGAAVYTAAIHLRPLPVDTTKCDFADGGGQGPLETAIGQTFEKDLLSPLLARTLFSDLASHFVPAFVPQFDRQLGLEFALENAFDDTFGSPALSEVFDDFIPSKDHPSTPYLLINATAAEGAEHFVGSQLRWGEKGHEPDDIRYFNDFWNSYESDRFSLMSMAGTSARFPFISPPGFIDEKQIGRRHFVDGGYYDNTGLETTLSLFRAIHRMTSVPIVVLHIGNQPACNQEDASPQILPSPSRCASLFFAGAGAAYSNLAAQPQSILFGVRSHQANLLRRSLEDTIIASNSGRQWDDETPPSGAIGLQITEESGPEPLGWFLSSPATARLDQGLNYRSKALRCVRGSKDADRFGTLRGIGYTARLSEEALSADRAFYGAEGGNIVPFGNQCGFDLIEEYFTRAAVLDDPPRNHSITNPVTGKEEFCTSIFGERWLTERAEPGGISGICF
ncbi:hypothetical protein HFN47_36060 [Rhizobium leguminosarum]|nr:hypothetical protein [Rhizobium leguminosarum]MBY5863173.1 hypothetical protein [Rhizobium leguminosarum]